MTKYAIEYRRGGKWFRLGHYNFDSMTMAELFCLGMTGLETRVIPIAQCY